MKDIKSIVMPFADGTTIDMAIKVAYLYAKNHGYVQAGSLFGGNRPTFRKVKAKGNGVRVLNIITDMETGNFQLEVCYYPELQP